MMPLTPEQRISRLNFLLGAYEELTRATITLLVVQDFPLAAATLQETLLKCQAKRKEINDDAPPA